MILFQEIKKCIGIIIKKYLILQKQYLLQNILSSDSECSRHLSECHRCFRSNSCFDFVFSQSSAWMSYSDLLIGLLRIPNFAFPPFNSLFLPGASSSAGFLDICEPPHVYECPVVMARPIPNSAAYELHEQRK